MGFCGISLQNAIMDFLDGVVDAPDSPMSEKFMHFVWDSTVVASPLGKWLVEWLCYGWDVGYCNLEVPLELKNELLTKMVRGHSKGVKSRRPKTPVTMRRRKLSKAMGEISTSLHCDGGQYSAVFTNRRGVNDLSFRESVLGLVTVKMVVKSFKSAGDSLSRLQWLDGFVRIRDDLILKNPGCISVCIERFCAFRRCHGFKRLGNVVGVESDHGIAPSLFCCRCFWLVLASARYFLETSHSHLFLSHQIMLGAPPIDCYLSFSFGLQPRSFCS